MAFSLVKCSMSLSTRQCGLCLLGRFTVPHVTALYANGIEVLKRSRRRVLKFDALPGQGWRLELLQLLHKGCYKILARLHFLLHGHPISRTLAIQGHPKFRYPDRSVDHLRNDSSRDK